MPDGSSKQWKSKINILISHLLFYGPIKIFMFSYILADYLRTIKIILRKYIGQFIIIV